LDLHFSDYSTIFSEFSKLLQKTLKQLYSRALELIFRNYTEVPGLRKQPWNYLHPCNVVPAGVGLNSGGRRGGGGARVSARGAPAGPPGVAGVRGPAGGAAGGPPRRRAGDDNRLSSAHRRWWPGWVTEG
jgi:hypothetical protein